MSNILVGVTGGIAAYKVCDVVSYFRKKGHNVDVIMTKNATEFVSPLTFETLSHNPVVTDTFKREAQWDVAHISLAKKADVFLVAPASANFIAKAANGICDDMLTTTFLAADCDKIVCPAMNVQMYENPIFSANLKKLISYGVRNVEPDDGWLACGDSGKGKLASIETVIEAVEGVLGKKNDYLGKTVLVTAGATREDIDGVRCLTNYSSGKMGKDLATAALARGAKVIYVEGLTKVDAPLGANVVKVTTTAEMYHAVMENLNGCDIVIKAAAPCDYTLKNHFENKAKGKTLSLEFEKTTDIAMQVGKEKGNRKLVIFAAETENLLEHAKEKMKNKNADMVIANDVTKKGAGFDSDTNIVSIITKKGIDAYDKMPKRELADLILDKILLI